MVTVGGKHHPTLAVLDRQHLPTTVNFDLDILRVHLTMLHIEPIRQVALSLRLSILNTHGIPCYDSHMKFAFSERKHFCLRGHSQHQH